MISARTTSVEETRTLAGEVAELARPGDVLLLAGELGSGKTAFAQGFGRGLGVTSAITSPTFTLARVHDGRLPMVHVDAYRVEDLQEVVDLGLAELDDERGVTLVEWGDMVAPALPSDALECRFERGADDNERLIAFVGAGHSWSSRQADLCRCLEKWLVGAC